VAVVVEIRPRAATAIAVAELVTLNEADRSTRFQQQGHAGTSVPAFFWRVLSSRFSVLSSQLVKIQVTELL
jgi:hypothetical protein